MFDRRIGINENGTQTLWTVYDGANAYMDFDGTGTLLTRYLNGLGMDERYANQTVGGAVQWYLTDNVGSVRQLAETNGTIDDAIHYDAFGTPHDSAAGDRFKFTGREYDAGAGQYYYRRGTMGRMWGGSRPRTRRGLQRGMWICIGMLAIRPYQQMIPQV